MQLKVNINESYSLWKNHKKINKHFIKKVLSNIIDYHPNIHSSELAISLLLCDNSDIAILNKQFRNKNAPTNVLSFPDSNRKLCDQNTSLEELYCGDLAFAYELISEEAKIADKKFEDHFTHLLIHGILHLLGYTHDKEIDANKMESLEVKLLCKLSITSPYNITK